MTDLPLISTLDKKQARSEAIKLGMARAKLWGTHIGRPRESADEFLSKPQYRGIIAGIALRLPTKAIAVAANCSVGTVKKYRKLMTKKQYKRVAHSDGIGSFSHLSVKGREMLETAIRRK
jgi:DNA invertase Pin-like site-specific DNA recombinase